MQVWAFKGSITSQTSILTLLISTELISKYGGGAVKVKIQGDECVSLDLPSGMNAQIRNALHGERFETQGEDDILPTDEFLIIQLGDTLAYDIGRRFDENNVVYDKEQYVQFIKDRDAEKDQLQKAIYAATATRSIRPNIAILQTKLDELHAYIEAVEVSDDNENSYDEAVETLLAGVDNYFEEIGRYQQEIPRSGGTEAEEDAVLEIERKIKQLDQKRRQKLDEVGYESPED